MKKKKLLNILAETSKIVAMEGDGLPSFWGFYEPTYSRGIEQTNIIRWSLPEDDVCVSRHVRLGI